MPMDEIEIIKQRLIEQVNPTCIYLFGSFANGTAHADSDLDFYIIVVVQLLCAPLLLRYRSPTACRRVSTVQNSR